MIDFREANNNCALTVSQFTRRLKTLVESNFSAVSVTGEVTDFTPASSGHLYFSLKDNAAKLSAVMWRSSAQKLARLPKNGEQITVNGEINIYEPRGNYQLIVKQIQFVGAGNAQAQLDALIEKLRAENLFSLEHKKILPTFARTIGLVTSPTGAALFDMIKVLRKRMPSVKIIISPCVVQGIDAPLSIVQALKNLDALNCDVILIGRGGGSRDDLAAFNDERVARAVYACHTPIISSVGHEIDVSICDLVADKRAATPSEAAEIATPDIMQLAQTQHLYWRALTQAMHHKIMRAREKITRLQHSPILQQPLNLLRRQQQQYDELEKRLHHAGVKILSHKKQRLDLIGARLANISPLQVLQRGYSVVRDAQQRIVKTMTSLKVDDELQIIFADGSADVRILDIIASDNG